MIVKILNKLLGNRNERLLKQLHKTVATINNLESTYAVLTDEALRATTGEFRSRLQNNETLEQLLPEAFAVVREVSKRVLHMRHFDVQLIGGLVLHSGKIAEMRTGEGKTLVATLPAYLNALSGKGVHVITVNDYLAKRDAEWMKRVYDFLGLTTGVILSDMPLPERQKAYAADVTYGTNNEFGFDYLRDNMAFNLSEKVQRELNFAIIDEVDSILIDEARTPLIISGPSEDSSTLYTEINQLIPSLTQRKKEEGEGDFYLDEKSKQAYLTEEGHQKIEELLTEKNLLEPGESLYHAHNINLMHHVYAALRAHYLFFKDVDYIVRNDEIIIVDEHTGRLMAGRRWSDGLHQAVEAKEKVRIQNENQTLASITFQNYFRLYEKLSGMTGTADTEAYEFQQIYGLEVVVIPTNKLSKRKDFTDQIYLTPEEKFKAIIQDIKKCIANQQPVLVGTASIETSEYLSDCLKKERIAHQVLNAKMHESEAQIIAEAGRPGRVTIATNMAGRGTDIVLGGNLEAELAQLPLHTLSEEIERHKAQWQERHDQVIRASGLHIIGSERHESRRIDNQLRGRAGRQGDPGSSRFYLSLQDNLMRIFASERMSGIMQKLGMEKGEAIEHPWINKAISNAQRKVEGRNFDIRKQLLEFDDVANEQRKVIYQQRNEILAAPHISSLIENLFSDVIHQIIHQYIPPQSLEEQWDIPGLQTKLQQEFGISINLIHALENDPELHEETLIKKILPAVELSYHAKKNATDSATFQQMEKSIMLQTLDTLWKDHLAAMDHLRQGIHLRGYAQKNPKQEYKRESFELFSSLLDQLKYQVATTIGSLKIYSPEEIDQIQTPPLHNRLIHLNFQHPSLILPSEGKPDNENTALSETEQSKPLMSNLSKVGRNDLCPCGSSKKYKHCHGKLE